MPRRICQIRERNRPEAMEEAPYLSEKRFQELLARHPDLLAGDQIDKASPRRFVLVAPEGTITEPDGGQGGADAW